MKTCTSCGQSVQDTQTYCPRCGSGNFSMDRNAQMNNQMNQRNPQQGNTNMPRNPQQQPNGFRNPQGYGQQGGQPPMQGGQPPMQGGQPPYGFNPNNRGAQPNMQNNGFGNNGQQQYPPQNTQNMNNGFRQPQPNQQMGGFNQNPQMGGFGQNNNANRQFNGNNEQTTGIKGFFSSVGSGSDVTIKEWAIMYLKLLIPIYNIIFIVNVLRGKEEVKPSMLNFFKMYIIILAAMLVFGLISSFTLGSLFASLFRF